VVEDVEDLDYCVMGAALAAVEGIVGGDASRRSPSTCVARRLPTTEEPILEEQDRLEDIS